MSKAMLIMDMPRCCVECPCFNENYASCSKEKLYLSLYNIEAIKPNWCPLRELPEKKESDIEKYHYGEMKKWHYSEGYNACIDEILGGGE